MSRFRRSDEGFTLVELLVVIIIIGVLAAVAIPVFLGDRRKGSDATVKADLRNAGTAEEAYATDNAAYTSSPSLLPGFQASTGNAFKVAVSTTTNAGFCVVGRSSASVSYYLYDSNAGGLRQTAQSSLSAAMAACTVSGATWAGTLT